ncbi:dual specificity phosphatase [Fragilaria crotonensis]|nr:dual specificity phosphatase [Fragilaria crotonensis]
MGAVHGVYLKYVGLSAISYAGYSMLVSGSGASDGRSLTANEAMPLWKFGAAAVFGYSAILNGAIAVMFKMERGMWLIGKDRLTGQIPMWSYLLPIPSTYPCTPIFTRVSER